jgi:hypothetical protein
MHMPVLYQRDDSGQVRRGRPLVFQPFFLLHAWLIFNGMIYKGACSRKDQLMFPAPGRRNHIIGKYRART